jgi:hypothetical protein
MMEMNTHDGSKTRRDSPRKRKVEDPVRGSRQTLALCAHPKREDLRRVRPTHRSHRNRKRAHEKIRAHDDPLGHAIVARDNPGARAVDRGSPVSESALEAADEEEPEGHEGEAGEEHGAAAPFVDVDDGGDGGDDVEDVVDGRGDEVCAPTGDACAFEHVDDVVHHDAMEILVSCACGQTRDSLHAGKLRPHLEGRAQEHTAEDTRPEQIRPLLRSLGTLKLDRRPDLVVLELDELGVGVAAAVYVGQDLEGFVVAVVVHEPARGFGEPGHAGGEDEAGDELETPGDAEGRDAIDVGAAELDKVLEETGEGVSVRTDGVGGQTYMPQVMAHCWSETMRPRIAGGVISDWYKGTVEEAKPIWKNRS